MRLGAVFPHSEIGNDPRIVKQWTEAVEALGYDHIAIFEHVLGVNRASRPNWNGPYDHTDAFYEPFVLMGYLTAITERLEFATSILVLPQRQTALVAKQAAAVDLLSSGRLRLGVASGWNDTEFEALGEHFKTRGSRIEEQIKLMRLFWTEELVTFKGSHHQVKEVGINPLPVQRPIPLWLGGSSDRVLRRVGHVADGWFANSSPLTAAYLGIPSFTPDKEGLKRLAIINEAAREVNRDPRDIGVEVRVEMVHQTPEQAASEVKLWQSIDGVTHSQFTTMRAGLTNIEDHIDALQRFIESTRT